MVKALKQMTTPREQKRKIPKVSQSVDKIKMEKTPIFKLPLENIKPVSETKIPSEK